MAALQRATLLIQIVAPPGMIMIEMSRRLKLRKTTIKTMIVQAFDIGFLFSPDEGHYCCICSRCLERIGRGEDALRILSRTPYIGFEEYRYCERCQQSAGITAAKRPHPILEHWRATVGKQKRYALSRAEMAKFVSRTRADRTKIGRGQMHYVHTVADDLPSE